MHSTGLCDLCSLNMVPVAEHFHNRGWGMAVKEGIRGKSEILILASSAKRTKGFDIYYDTHNLPFGLLLQIHWKFGHN